MYLLPNIYKIGLEISGYTWIICYWDISDNKIWQSNCFEFFLKFLKENPLNKLKKKNKNKLNMNTQYTYTNLIP